MATTNDIAQAAILKAEKQAIKISLGYQTKSAINNAQRIALAWSTVLAIVPVVQDLSNNAFKLARKAYENAGEGVARKTAQCHFGMARAIAKGNFDAPRIGKSNADKMKLPSVFKTFEGFTAEGEIAKPKTVPSVNTGDKRGTVNGPQTGGQAEDGKGVPQSYVTDTPELRQALAALTKAFTSDTPPSRPVWQDLRRQFTVVTASVRESRDS